MHEVGVIEREEKSCAGIQAKPRQKQKYTQELKHLKVNKHLLIQSYNIWQQAWRNPSASLNMLHHIFFKKSIS